MKKALVILMALSMVFAAFADEPTVTNAIAEFKGDATVTWGVNLDGQVDSTGKKTYTGFTNSESASLKFTLMGTGDKVTTGEGVWGEIKVKVGDPLQYDNGTWKNGTASVDYAKIHLLDNMLAIGIRSGDNTFGEYTPTVAVHNYNKDSKSYAGKGIQGAKVGGTVTQGITVEFTHDLLDLNIDFRSLPAAYAAATAPDEVKYDGTNWAAYQAYLDAKAKYDADEALKSGAFKGGYYTDHYGIGTDINIKAVDNLSLKAGFGMDFFEPSKMGIFAAAEYKAAITDVIYVKPQVAFTMQNDSKKAKADLNLIGALLVGWNGDDAQDSVKFVDGKVRNGFSVATNLDLSAAKLAVPLCIGVWDSSFVENLKVGAELCIDNLSAFSNKYYVAFDCAYAIGTITPKFAIKLETKDFYLYGAVDYTGIANTTLTLAYESGALNKKSLGTINLSAKVFF